MVLWSKEQDKLPDMSAGTEIIEVKKDFISSNGSVHPVILAAGAEERQPSGGEYELTEVTSLPEHPEAENERTELVVIDCHPNAKGQREEDALLENGSQSNESDDTSTDQSPVPPVPLKETSFSIGLQVVFPFLLAGFGTVAAGMVLDIVQVRNPKFNMNIKLLTLTRTFTLFPLQEHSVKQEIYLFVCSESSLKTGFHSVWLC